MTLHLAWGLPIHVHRGSGVAGIISEMVKEENISSWLNHTPTAVWTYTEKFMWLLSSGGRWQIFFEFEFFFSSTFKTWCLQGVANLYVWEPSTPCAFTKRTYNWDFLDSMLLVPTSLGTNLWFPCQYPPSFLDCVEHLSRWQMLWKAHPCAKSYSVSIPQARTSLPDPCPEGLEGRPADLTQAHPDPWGSKVNGENERNHMEMKKEKSRSECNLR